MEYATEKDIETYNKCQAWKNLVKLYYFGKISFEDIWLEFQKENWQEEKFKMLLNLFKIYDGKIELKEPKV